MGKMKDVHIDEHNKYCGMDKDNDIVTFESAPVFYNKEIAGLKNNTVRVLDAVECNTMLYYKPSRIRIECEYDTFVRNISDISVVGELLGKKIVVISWYDAGAGSV